MNTMVLLVWSMGRDYWVVYGYILGGWLMATLAPRLLVCVSFLLSMAAKVAGVVWGTAILERLTRSFS
jgi:hypothetical protein